MRYKLTLLKDLPDYPAGTVFKYRNGLINCLGSFKKEEFMGVAGSDSLTGGLCFPRKILDDPTWIKKEIDYDSLKDLKCPICGETRGEMSVHSFRYGNSYDGYGYASDVFFEYACGHETRQLW